MEHTHVKRRLKAILLADVVGYSRLMSVDERGTHIKVNNYTKDLIEPKIVEHSGRLIRTMGDGFLIEFDSAADAVLCGIEIQEEMRADDAAGSDPRIRLRIGINTGDVIADDRDIYGHSVNIAARLEGLAEPGEVYITRGVRDQLAGHIGLSFEDLGERWVKNIKTPVHVYRARRAEAPPSFLIALARRFSPTRLRFANRRTVFSGAALAAVLTVGVAGLPAWRDQAALPSRASIMVLPFRNASDDQGQDYFADAVTDDLTTDLSRLSDTVVISSGTAFTYKGKPVDPREIGREFGVRYLLEGSIRKSGMKVQTNAQLVDARTAAHIWADRFENEFTDLFELQAAITGRIASSLRIQLVKVENHRAIAQREADPDAIDLRLHAMSLLVSSFTPENCLNARRFLEESVRLNPDSASAWSHLSWVLISDYLNRWNDAEKDPVARADIRQRAENALQEALRIDPSIALAHLADGLIRRTKGDHQGAADAYDRAIQLDPNFALAYAQKANQLVLLGRSPEAPPLVLKAIRLTPRDPSIGVFYWIIGRAYFVMKNYDDAIVWLRKSVEVRPNLWFTRAYLLSAYALAGRHQQPETVAALSEYNGKFSGHSVQYISDVYSKEVYNNEDFRLSLEELYKGLRLAGMQ